MCFCVDQRREIWIHLLKSSLDGLLSFLQTALMFHKHRPSHLNFLHLFQIQIEIWILASIGNSINIGKRVVKSDLGLSHPELSATLTLSRV